MKKSYLLTLQCMNRPGIVAGVATRLAAHGGNITAAQQFDECVGRVEVRDLP